METDRRIKELEQTCDSLKQQLEAAKQANGDLGDQLDGRKICQDKLRAENKQLALDKQALDWILNYPIHHRVLAITENYKLERPALYAAMLATETKQGE